MRESPYFAQAELLVRCLPALDAAPDLALKGGTAINLFWRDLPRLSVDIDLAYTSVGRRVDALREIAAGLDRLSARAQALVPGLNVLKTGTNEAPKRILRSINAQVVVEPNPVIRGAVFPASRRRLMPEAEALFGLSAEVSTVSFADLYAGKLCAALDRSHPRDWFDLLLLEHAEGVTDQVRQAFVVYVASHSRPMAELLSPRSADMRRVFEREFAGMPRNPVGLGDLEAARTRVPVALRCALTDDERHFLVSIKRGEPDWGRMPFAHLADLPALNWKLRNIAELRSTSPRKHAEAVERLRRVLDL